MAIIAYSIHPYKRMSMWYEWLMEIRTILVIFASVAIKGLILSWWGRFKARKALEPTPLARRNGIYIPWGPVERVNHYGIRAFALWAAYIAVLLIALVYVKVVLPYL